MKIRDGLTVAEIEERIKKSKDTEQYKRWHAVYLIMTQSLSGREIAKIEGVTPDTIYNWARMYNKKGPEALVLKGRGGRRRGLMSWEEEEKLLRGLEEEAIKGIIIVGKTINEKVEKKLGKKVHKNYAYTLLHRHGWRKIRPRSRHPKARKQEQEDKKVKKLLCFALLVFTGICLNGCGVKKENKEENVVKIALVCPLTGDIAAMGQGMKNAATLAIEEANQNEVIKDARLKLAALDDRADPKEAVNAATQIVSDKKVYGVVGHLNSGCSIPASAVYNRHNLVMISPASTNPKLTFQGFKNILRICTTDDVQGSFAAEVIYKNSNLTKVAVIHDKTPYGQGLAEEFKKTFQGLGGIIVCFEGISLGDRDFKALLIKIKNLGPQAIYFGGMYQEAGLISKQAKQLGLNVPLAGGDGIYSSEYIKIAGNAAEGDLATMIGLPKEKLPKAKDFIEKYKNRFPNRDIQPYDPYTYDAVNIMIEAVKNAGRDKIKIIEYIKIMKYEGIIGTTQFDDKGDTLNKEVTCYEVKDGKWAIAE